MPRLYKQDTGETLGELTQAQLQFLIDQLEEESEDDQDYYINRPMLEILAEGGCDPALLEMLTRALGEAAGVDVAWE